MTEQPIARRMAALATLSAGGAALFIPFLAASAHPSSRSLAGFVIVVTATATLLAWPGLRCADAVELPMPYLRALDGIAVVPPRRHAFTVTLMVGAIFGIVGLLLLRVTHAPALPGSATARALSTLFAAGPLEIVLHLGVMSMVVRFARGRRSAGIAAAAVALVLFHLSGGGLTEPPLILLAAVAANAALGAALGSLYAVYGFEFAMLGHAVAHLITVGVG